MLCSETQKFLGVITKDDILDAIVERGSQDYVELMDTPINVCFFFCFKNISTKIKTYKSNSFNIFRRFYNLMKAKG